MPNCTKCRYRAQPNAGYLCDYYAITNRLRAQSIAQCTHFDDGTREGASWRKAQPTEPRYQPRKLDAEKCRRLYNEGLTDAAIGRELGVTDATVRTWRKRMELGAVARKGRSE